MVNGCGDGVVTAVVWTRSAETISVVTGRRVVREECQSTTGDYVVLSALSVAVGGKAYRSNLSWNTPALPWMFRLPFSMLPEIFANHNCSVCVNFIIKNCPSCWRHHESTITVPRDDHRSCSGATARYHFFSTIYQRFSCDTFHSSALSDAVA